MPFYGSWDIWSNVCVCLVVSNSLRPRGLHIAHQVPLSMGILQARILEWIAMPSSTGSFQPRDRTLVSRIAGRFFTVWDQGSSCLFLQTYFILPLSAWTALTILASFPFYHMLSHLKTFSTCLKKIIIYFSMPTVFFPKGMDLNFITFTLSSLTPGQFLSFNPVLTLGEAGRPKPPTLARYHGNHLHEVLGQEVLVRNMELISHHQLGEFRKGQKVTPLVQPPPRILLAGIHLGWTKRAPPGRTLSQNDWLKTTRKLIPSP